MKTIKKILVLFVWVLIAFSCNTKIDTDKKTIANQDRILKVKGSTLSVERQDKDSLNFYIQESEKLKKAHKTNLALEQLNLALYYASTQEDIDFVKKEIMEVDL